MKKRIFTLVILLLTFATIAFGRWMPDIIVTGTDGIWTDTRFYASIDNAIAAALLTGEDRDIYIVREEATDTLTIHPAAHLHFFATGSIANTGQLTINSTNISASNRQIFTGVGDIDWIAGSVVKTSWFSNLDEAFDVTYDHTLTMIVTEAEASAANMEVGNNVTLKWNSPFILSIGGSLTNVKNIEAGNYQIFAGAGDIDFLDGTRFQLDWVLMLRTILNWIETEEVTIVVSGSNAVTTTDTATANEYFDFESEQGSFAITGGDTLTLDSPGVVIATVKQLIKSGDGALAFTNGGTAYTPWFGATGNGTTNDIVAINETIASGPVNVHSPWGNYLVNAPIDLTDLAQGRTFSGDGRSHIGGTQFYCNTGAKCMDISGSGDITIKDLRLRTDVGAVVNDSVVGIFMSRTAASYGSRPSLENLHIFIDTDATANNNNGTVGVYIYQVEQGTIKNCDIRADWPLVFARENVFTITSDLVATVPVASMSNWEVGGNSELRLSAATETSPLYIQGGVNIKVDAYYQGAPTSGLTSAIRLTETYNCTTNGQIEGFGRAIYINGLVIAHTAKLTQNLNLAGGPLGTISSVVYLDGDNPDAHDVAIPAGTPFLSNSFINILPVIATPVLSAIESVTAPSGIRYTTIYIYTNQDIDVASSAFKGNILFSQTEPTVSALAGSISYTAYNGVDIVRLGDQLGTLAVGGDFVLHANWGATASVGSVAATNRKGGFVISASGGGYGVNPTVILTFPVAWDTAPICIVGMRVTDQAALLATKIGWSCTATTLILTFYETPTAGDYTFNYIASN